MNITLDDKFFDDKRINCVARLTGECEATVTGRLVFLWRYCSRQRNDVLTAREIETNSARFGDGGYGDILVEADLASKVSEGKYRIRGVAKRIGYLKKWDEHISTIRAAAGKSRAVKAVRDEGGKYKPANQQDGFLLVQQNQQNQLYSSSSPSPSPDLSFSPDPIPSDLTAAPPAPPKVNGVGVWKAYSEAYQKRWGVIPPRHQVNNTLAKKVAEKLGMEDGPRVATFYLQHPDRFYVSNKHALNLLVRDADKLYTEWKMGRASTSREADLSDRRGTAVNALNDFLSMEET